MDPVADPMSKPDVVNSSMLKDMGISERREKANGASGKGAYRYWSIYVEVPRLLSAMPLSENPPTTLAHYSYGVIPAYNGFHALNCALRLVNCGKKKSVKSKPTLLDFEGKPLSQARLRAKDLKVEEVSEEEFRSDQKNLNQYQGEAGGGQ